MRSRRLLFVAAGCALVGAGWFAWRWLAHPAVPPSAEPDPRATLRVCLGCEPSTLDPAQVTTVQETFVAMALYEGLYTHDPHTLEPRPAMAEVAEVSLDGLTWTFHLRDARWSNGDEVSAEDFAWSWRRAQDPATRAPYARLFRSIREAKADGRRTLVVTLDAPEYWLPSLLCLPPFLPVHRASVEGSEAWQLAGKLVGNGPFTLRRRRWRESLLLVRNPSYWDADRVKLAGVEALSWDNPSRAVEQYESGAVDWTWGPLPAGASSLARRDDWRSCTRLAVRVLRFNARNAPFQDVRVRRAFSLALDRDDLARALSGELPALSLVPPCVQGYAPFVLSPSAEEAQRLLAEAGHARGAGLPEIEVLCAAEEGEKRIADEVAARWKATLGVGVVVRAEEAEDHIADERALRFRHVSLSSASAEVADARAFLARFSANGEANQAGWRSDWFASLVDQASLASNPSLRAGLLRQAERALLQDEAVVAPLTFPRAGFLLHRRVHGVWENALDVHPLKDVMLEAKSGQE